METEPEHHTPTLSVTVLNYNYAHYLPQCLDSILSQTWTDFELILINDCSTDNSLEVIQPYLADPRIKFVNHEVNKGFVSSLIEGSDMSRADYISVISADDYVLNTRAFELALRFLAHESNVSLLFSAWHEVDSIGSVLYTRRSADSDYTHEGTQEFIRLLQFMPILHSGTIIRRQAFLSVGGYDRRLKFAIDISMWLALCSTGKVAYINAPLYAYRAHQSNMSHTKAAIWQATEEWLNGIDTAIALFAPTVLGNKRVLRRIAYRHALVAIPTHDIFSGRLRRGWTGYWESFRHFPILTSLQHRTISLVLRTILGSAMYQSLIQRNLGHKRAVKLLEAGSNV